MKTQSVIMFVMFLVATYFVPYMLKGTTPFATFGLIVYSFLTLKVATSIVLSLFQSEKKKALSEIRSRPRHIHT